MLQELLKVCTKALNQDETCIVHLHTVLMYFVNLWFPVSKLRKEMFSLMVVTYYIFSPLCSRTTLCLTFLICQMILTDEKYTEVWKGALRSMFLWLGVNKLMVTLGLSKVMRHGGNSQTLSVMSTYFSFLSFAPHPRTLNFFTVWKVGISPGILQVFQQFQIFILSFWVYMSTIIGQSLLSLQKNSANITYEAFFQRSCNTKTNDLVSQCLTQLTPQFVTIWPVSGNSFDFLISFFVPARLSLKALIMLTYP